MNNPYLLHLIPNTNALNPPDSFWLRTQALKRTSIEALITLVSKEYVDAAVEIYCQRFLPDNTPAIEPHFGLKKFSVNFKFLRGEREHSVQVLQKPFAIELLEIPVTIAEKSYTMSLSASDRKIQLSDAGLRRAYRMFCNNVPELTILGKGAKLKSQTRKDISMPNAYLSQCVVGQFGIEPCKWILQLIVSKDISVSKESRCAFAKLFATTDDGYEIDGGIPREAFKHCLVMLDEHGRKFLVLTSSKSIRLRDRGTYYEPREIWDTRNITFVRKCSSLHLPLGL